MSFLYALAKQVMFGKGAIGAESVASLSLGSSVNVALILASHTTDEKASTTGSLRSVFSSRALDTTAGHVSQSNDIVLTGNEISSSNGITFFDATDVAFSCSNNQVIAGLLVYKAIGGVDATSLPIAFINISTTTANGSTINVNWDNGVNRIFSLT